MSNELSISTKRMLKLKDWLKAAGVIQTDQDFWDTINFRKQNVHNIRTGHQSFRINHISKAIIHYQNINEDLANPYFLLNIPRPKTNNKTPNPSPKKMKRP